MREAPFGSWASEGDLGRCLAVRTAHDGGKGEAGAVVQGGLGDSGALDLVLCENCVDRVVLLAPTLTQMSVACVRRPVPRATPYPRLARADRVESMTSIAHDRRERTIFRLLGAGSTLIATDPESIAVFDKRGVPETVARIALVHSVQAGRQFGALIAAQSLCLYWLALGAALTDGLTRVEINKVVHQSVPHDAVSNSKIAPPQTTWRHLWCSILVFWSLAPRGITGYGSNRGSRSLRDV